MKSAAAIGWAAYDPAQTPTPIVPGNDYGQRVLMPGTEDYLTRITALMDGGGSGSGSQPVRGVLWNESGELLAQTEEVFFNNGDELGWYDFNFADPPAGLWTEGEEAYFALQGGGDQTIARVYSTPLLRNLVKNPSFELGTTGWQPAPATVDVFETTNVWAHRGSRSLRYRRRSQTNTGDHGIFLGASASNPDYSAVYTNPAPLPVDPSTPYTFRFQVNLLERPDHQGPWLYMTQFRADGSRISQGLVGLGWPTENGLGEQEIVINFTSNSQAARVAPFFGFWRSDNVGDSRHNLALNEVLDFQIDAVMLYPSHGTPEYFDGDIPGPPATNWEGDPHNSPSRQGTGWTKADSYADGPADPLSSISTLTKTPPMYIATGRNIDLPREDDGWYSRLGFPSAQAKLGETGPTGERFRANVSWHGTRLDPEPQGGSSALVQLDGDLAGLLGERIRLTYGRQSVVAYVVRSTDIGIEGVDISLSRRAFAALGRLSLESLPVTVEILS